MNTKEKIYNYIKNSKSVRSNELIKILGMSRQAVHKHLKKLIEEERIFKHETTKAAFYTLPSKNNTIKRVFSRTLKLKDLEEHVIFREADIFLNLQKKAKNNVYGIMNYAFTELLNNAIEHSKSQLCEIEITVHQYRYTVRIRDYGIGIFHSIYKKYNLRYEEAAVGELIKGKTTTIPEKHTGEGIFFTSKACDKLTFRSHKIYFVFDTIKDDLYVEEKRNFRGTEALFSIEKNSKRQLEDIFELYAPESFDYKFERTKISVRIFQKECISRSEARRMLFGLEKFKEIIFEFGQVKSIGQGFADEIFRVFHAAYPEIAIKVENLAPALQQILFHVVDNKNNKWLIIS